MFEQVKAILSEFVDADIDIKKESQLIVDLGLNSLDVVNAVIAFEEAFSIEIKDKDIKNLSTVEDIIRYIEEKT